jgi:hypothetical protein
LSELDAISFFLLLKAVETAKDVEILAAQNDPTTASQITLK